MDEMIKRHQAHNGGPFKRIDNICERYLYLQSIHPTNPLLKYACVNGNGHIEINEELLYKEKLPERDLEEDRKRIEEDRERLFRITGKRRRKENMFAWGEYSHLLSKEISLLSKCRVLGEDEVKVRLGYNYLSEIVA